MNINYYKKYFKYKYKYLQLIGGVFDKDIQSQIENIFLKSSDAIYSPNIKEIINIANNNSIQYNIINININKDECEYIKQKLNKYNFIVFTTVSKTFIDGGQIITEFFVPIKIQLEIIKYISQKIQIKEINFYTLTYIKKIFIYEYENIKYNDKIIGDTYMAICTTTLKNFFVGTSICIGNVNDYKYFGLNYYDNEDYQQNDKIHIQLPLPLPLHLQLPLQSDKAEKAEKAYIYIPNIKNIINIANKTQLTLIHDQKKNNL